MEILARGVGRRKEAVAQVKLVKGTGQFIINDIPYHQYLHNNTCSLIAVKAPLVVGTQTTQTEGNSKEKLSISVTGDNTKESFREETPMDNLDTIVKVKGGGLIGQAEAIKLGLARAICQLVNLPTETTGSEENRVGAEEIRKQLKDKGYLTQDSRVKERRKYGLKKARKASQYHKR
jgi:small subunit ribosomal protein S9